MLKELKKSKLNSYSAFLFAASAILAPSYCLSQEFIQSDAPILEKVLPQFNVLRSQKIDLRSSYLAFPYALKISNSIIILYSEGPEHARSYKQILARTDDFGSTFKSAVFYDGRTKVFDTSLLEDLLPDGGKMILKSWFVQRSSGRLTVRGPNFASGLGFDRVALVSRPHVLGSSIFRTGTKDGRAFMLESKDGGQTWIVVGIIAEAFAGDGRYFSEADLAINSDGNWLSVIREDASLNRSGRRARLLFASISEDKSGRRWGPLRQVSDQHFGVQPSLVKLSSGQILLMFGDRTGFSGLDDQGVPIDRPDITGIAAALFDPGGRKVTLPIVLTRFFSTDGGQPSPIEIRPGVIFSPFYARLNRAQRPGIMAITFEVDRTSAFLTP
jgi:hypothetical protein